jgi:hypothetical protein
VRDKEEEEEMMMVLVVEIPPHLLQPLFRNLSSNRETLMPFSVLRMKFNKMILKLLASVSFACKLASSHTISP